MNGLAIMICSDQCLIKSFTVYSKFISLFESAKRSAVRYNWMPVFWNHTEKGGEELKKSLNFDFFDS